MPSTGAGASGTAQQSGHGGLLGMCKHSGRNVVGSMVTDGLKWSPLGMMTERNH